MSISRESEKEVEQYGATVGIALANGLHEEGLQLAFTRGGGVAVSENVAGTSLPARAGLDANAVGGFDATLSYSHDSNNDLTGITVSSYGKQGAVALHKDGNALTKVSADKDGDGAMDATMDLLRKDGSVVAIRLDEDNDGKVDAVLSPKMSESDEPRLSGFNVDLGNDGSIDGIAEFIRNQQGEVKQIRFRKIESL
jgi:hypothetical protein